VKNLVLLGLLVSSVAFAQENRDTIPFRAWPLIGKQICSNPELAINDNLKAVLSSDQQTTVKEALTRRAAAYRLSQKCTLPEDNAFIEADVELGDPLNGTRSFIVYLEVYQFDERSGGAITLWHTYRYGVIQGDAAYLRDSFVESIGLVLDSLAADYAKANP